MPKTTRHYEEPPDMISDEEIAWMDKTERAERLRKLNDDVTRATKRAERNPNKVNLAFLQRALADRRRFMPK
jgi:hypothetical protein